MVLSLFEYLDQVTNHKYYVQLWQTLKKNAVTFDLTKIERKKLHFTSRKFCCASNVAIKNLKIARQNSTFSNFFQ